MIWASSSSLLDKLLLDGKKLMGKLAIFTFLGNLLDQAFIGRNDV